MTLCLFSHFIRRPLDTGRECMAGVPISWAIEIMIPLHHISTLSLATPNLLYIITVSKEAAMIPRFIHLHCSTRLTEGPIR